jgi:hypothetical protein
LSGLAYNKRDRYAEDVKIGCFQIEPLPNNDFPSKRFGECAFICSDMPDSGLSIPGHVPMNRARIDTDGFGQLFNR